MNILQEVQDIFREVFEEDDLVIKLTTKAQDIEAWDSLNHIQLIGAIEDEFDIEFELNDVVSFKNVEDILTAIKRLK